MRRLVVHAGNERHTDDEGRAPLPQHIGMAQDRRVVHAGEVLMPRGIGQLDVHHDEVERAHDLAEHFVAHKAARFNGAVNAVKMRDHVLHERPLHQRLAAGKRHAAAALFKQTAPLEQALRQRFRFHARARDAPQAIRTVRQAGSARRAVIGMGTVLHTFAAMGAARRADGQLRLGRKTLGIVAPLAAQRTALHEHGRADAGAVEHGKFLDVEYGAGAHAPIISSTRWMM